MLLKTTAKTTDPNITYVYVISVIQLTGTCPINRSRRVPPPIAVTNAIKKPLTQFQEGLLEFFKYINRETNDAVLINVQSTDELGQMAQAVNDNITQIKTYKPFYYNKEKNIIVTFSIPKDLSNVIGLSKLIPEDLYGVMVKIKARPIIYNFTDKSNSKKKVRGWKLQMLSILKK